jgi:hypothetical protein
VQPSRISLSFLILDSFLHSSRAQLANTARLARSTLPILFSSSGIATYNLTHKEAACSSVLSTVWLQFFFVTHVGRKHRRWRCLRREPLMETKTQNWIGSITNTATIGPYCRRDSTSDLGPILSDSSSSSSSSFAYTSSLSMRPRSHYSIRLTTLPLSTRPRSLRSMTTPTTSRHTKKSFPSTLDVRAYRGRR